MCLSTAYLNSDGTRREVMKDVARIEAVDGGVWLINLFDERQFVENSTVRTIDLVNDHTVILERTETNAGT
ncbi:CooT family nickel-binding protein [Desulfatitalea alkaliphila]|uniref:CooT family nickel-binding protein n=1 Tax=Desulfatitalea alkaliphila TaxID=2929485 RepID=A0AA41R4A0_9BACT|nr:CooT family nickel-binding protein [Desulfatitalea alkaliphila]MCJ8501381.1 CooT family nickel-binding protein [Desulfatitalea alkaliphila]